MYESASSGIYYYHTDPAGTPLAVTNTSGKIVWRGYYEPFGNEYAVQGTISNDVRFAGNKKDAETGLNHFGARYMDATLGRFMAPDPIGPVDSKTGKINAKILTELQRLNAYAYALNGPGRYVDRSGKNPILIAAAAVYLLLHHPDIANAPGSPTDPTYASNGAGDIADGGLFIIGGIQAIEQAANPAPDFVVSPDGTVFPVPQGAKGPVPVINRQGDRTGTAYTGGSGGENGQVDTIRMMDATLPNGKSPGYPDGYIK